jgi:glycosyltransferase involved in cell wall biosynthesis
MFGAARGRADVVIATSPPLSVGAAGAWLAKRHRAPWVLDVRDLWPDVAAIVGEVPEGSRLYRAAERLERRLYRSADAVVTTTEPFRRKIVERGGDRVEVIPNGTTAEWLEVGKQSPDRAVLGLPGDRFVWTYAGNLGLAQGLDAAVAAAGKLGDGFQLVLLGEGPREAQLREQASASPAGSVIFRDPVPPEQAATLMRASDALLVPLSADSGMDGFVPSKLFDSAAVGRPVVVATGGESARLVEEGDAALSVPPGDPDELANAIRRLRDDRELAAGLGERGRAFAANYDRAKGAARLAHLIEDLSSEGPSG